MKKIVFLFCLCLCAISFTFAQTISFKVIDISTGLPIWKVKVASTPEQRFITYSDGSGKFSHFIVQDDTIQLSKDQYHPLYLKISSTNFDSTHSVVIGLVPLEKKKGKLSGEYQNLKNFEYHFVYDTLGEKSNLKVHLLENVHAFDYRRKNDQSFRFGAVDIDSPPSISDPNRTYKSKYRLIK